MITAVLTSDNHLGANYARFRPDRLELRRKRLQKAFETVVDRAIQLRADLFLHAGDLFDRPDPRNDERLCVARQLRRLQEVGIPIVAIAGNHDSPRSYGYGGGVVPLEEVEALQAVNLLRRTDGLQCAEFTLRGQQVRVYGMSSDFNRSADVCPLEGMTLAREHPDTLQLLLLHYGVRGWITPFSEEPILSLENLDLLQADAICVGHLHARMEQRLPGGALLINPGATERINFGEENNRCGFTVLRGEPGHIEAEHVEIPTQPMRTLDLELFSDLSAARTVAAQEETAVQWLQSLTDRILAVSHPDQLLRVRFRGQIPRNLFQALDLQALQNLGSRSNFHCQLDLEAMTVFDPDREVPLGYGVSFDVAEELGNITEGLKARHNDDPTIQELYSLAYAQVQAKYDELTRGGR